VRKIPSKITSNTINPFNWRTDHREPKPNNQASNVQKFNFACHGIG